MQQNLLDQLWEPDRTKTFAKITITPVKRGDESYFGIEETVEVRPYPNPFMFGGMYGHNSVRTEAEVEKQIEWLQRFLKSYESSGLKGVELEIVRNPEMTQTECSNYRREEWINRHPEDKVEMGQKLLL